MRWNKPNLPFPFLASADGEVKMFEAMWFRAERGVFGTPAPKLSLLPPPGGFSTLKRAENQWLKIGCMIII